MELWKEFARLESNGLFPAWWYYGQTAVRHVALKTPAADWLRPSSRKSRKPLREALAPVQMGVGVKVSPQARVLLCARLSSSTRCGC